MAAVGGTLTLANRDEIVCMICSKPGNDMKIRQVQELGRSVFCTVCQMRKSKMDKVHACLRENDTGHKQSQYLKTHNQCSIGKSAFVVCISCRHLGRDRGNSWTVVRNYWSRIRRNVTNEP